MATINIAARVLKNGQPRFVVRYRVGGRTGKLVHCGSFPTRELAEHRKEFVEGQLAAYGYFDHRNLEPNHLKRNRGRKSLPRAIRFEVLYRAGFACQYCGARAPEVILCVDHIKPVINGGDDDLSNLAAACVECNTGKAGRLLRFPDGIPVMAQPGVLHGKPSKEAEKWLESSRSRCSGPDEPVEPPYAVPGAVSAPLDPIDNESEVHS